MNQPPYPYQQPMQAPPAKKSPLGLCLIIAAVVVGLLIVLIVIFGVLGIYGTRRYLVNAKTAEGKSTLGAIARGMTTCMEREELTPSSEPRELPASSPPVPASVPKGVKYQSTASDWASPAFTCARFSVSEPQYFQYEWEKVSAMKGIIHARADLDGDGKVDVDLELDVTCTPAGGCTHGMLLEK